MKTKPVIPREAAHRDVDEAVEHYQAEGSEQAALGFIDALEQAYGHIGRHPVSATGIFEPLEDRHIRARA